MRDLERAQIVLLAAEGLPADEIASRVGCLRPTVTLWRRRYEKDGIDGLGDAPAFAMVRDQTPYDPDCWKD